MILEAFVAREQCNGGVVLEHTNCLDEDVWAGILNLIACIDSELVDPLGVVWDLPDRSTALGTRLS